MTHRAPRAFQATAIRIESRERRDRGPDSALERERASAAPLYVANASVARRRLLWIEDQPELMKPVVSYLAEHGYDVEFATSGEDGLEMAGLGNYSAILLDLKLPDAHGLDLLDRLAPSGNRSPVIVITGYGSTESALIAGRYGAAAYKSKPLIGADLVELIRSVLAFSMPFRPFVGLVRRDTSGSSSMSFTEVLKLLDELGSAATPPMDDRLELRSVVSTPLALAAADPDLTLIQFSGIAEALRWISRLGEIVPRAAVLFLRDRLDVVSRLHSGRVNRIVEQLVAIFEGAGNRCLHLRRAVVARGLKIDQKELSKLIAREIGLSFPRLRRLVVMRRAVQMIVTSDEQLAQIGYAVGYESLSAFDRGFASVLGTSPGQYRQLVTARGSRSSLPPVTR